LSEDVPAVPAVPAVPDVEDPPGSFGHGIAVGVAITAVLVHIALVGLTGDWARLYADFGSTIPLLTTITISLAWQLGVPVIGVLAIGALVVRRPRSLVPYAAAAVLFALAAAATYWLPMMPIAQVAGQIKGPE
jgi:hypothetical protein